ncbi:Gp49 family protein [Pseudomonas aeruginosa]|uniref:Gp49 family protein n=1 Tax=Pseudomonas aeruginosa TaxID=287 RepID=UPI003AAC796A
MTDEAIEQEIQAKGLTAPRITPADIEANIAGEYYFTAADGVNQRPDCNPDAVVAGVHGSLGLLTFCVLVLKNGFTVTGEPACCEPGELRRGDPGLEISRQNAVSKIWPLMGYELRSRLAD